MHIYICLCLCPFNYFPPPPWFSTSKLPHSSHMGVHWVLTHLPTSMSAFALTSVLENCCSCTMKPLPQENQRSHSGCKVLEAPVICATPPPIAHNPTHSVLLFCLGSTHSPASGSLLWCLFCLECSPPTPSSSPLLPATQMPPSWFPQTLSFSSLVCVVIQHACGS